MQGELFAVRLSRVGPSMSSRLPQTMPATDRRSLMRPARLRIKACLHARKGSAMTPRPSGRAVICPGSRAGRNTFPAGRCPVGTQCWPQLSGGTEVQLRHNDFAAEFDVPPARRSNDRQPDMSDHRRDQRRYRRPGPRTRWRQRGDSQHQLRGKLRRHLLEFGGCAARPGHHHHGKHLSRGEDTTCAA